MIGFLLLVLASAADDYSYVGCGCCSPGEGDESCSTFSGEWSQLYQCISKVDKRTLPTDPNWFLVPRQKDSAGNVLPYTTCTAPVGRDVSEEEPVIGNTACSCFEAMSDRLKYNYNCTTNPDLLEALDEVCNELNCKYCNFLPDTPKCGSIQLRRCDLIYQSEIALVRNPTRDDICRALTKKVDCYEENHCVYADTDGMQQAVKQCRNSTCPACYQICKNGASTMFALLAVLLVVFAL